MVVGLSIRFGRNQSISVGQSRTPSKSVEYQPKLFLRWISAENLLDPTKTVGLLPIFDQ
jgi:hypothetical protein